MGCSRGDSVSTKQFAASACAEVHAPRELSGGGTKNGRRTENTTKQGDRGASERTAVRAKTGGGGIRTPETVIPPNGFQNRSSNPPTDCPSRTYESSDSGGTKYGTKDCAVGSDPPRSLSSDDDLSAIAAAWPDLPNAIRAGIVAMVRAAVSDFR